MHSLMYNRLHDRPLPALVQSDQEESESRAGERNVLVSRNTGQTLQCRSSCVIFVVVLLTAKITQQKMNTTKSQHHRILSG